MVARELENGGPDGPVSLENLLQGRRTESGIDGRVQGEIKKSSVEFLDRGQMHKVKHRQRGSKKMQSAADDGLGRSLHVNVDRWGRRLGFGVEQLAEENGDRSGTCVTQRAASATHVRRRQGVHKEEEESPCCLSRDKNSRDGVD